MMLDPLAHIHQQIGEAIRHWRDAGGWEKLSLALIWFLGLTIAVMMLAVVADAIFGFGIFPGGACCNDQDSSTVP